MLKEVSFLKHHAPFFGVHDGVKMLTNQFIFMMTGDYFKKAINRRRG